MLSSTLFPADLSPIRDSVIALMSHSPEAGILQSCRGFRSQCMSVFCPCCSIWQSTKRGNSLLAAQSAVEPSRLRAATFRVQDVPRSDVRSVAKESMKAIRLMRSRLQLTGSAFRLEASTPAWDTTLRHVHIHGSLDGPATGRNRLSASAIEDVWLTSLPSSLHPSSDPSRVEGMHTPDAWARYTTKSAFRGVELDDLDQLIRTLDALKGTDQFIRQGTLAN